MFKRSALKIWSGRRLACWESLPSAKKKTSIAHILGSAALRRRAFGSHTIQRNKDFKVLDDKDVAHFESMLEKQCVITDEAEIAPWNADWTNKYVGASKLMLKPKSNEEVAAILKYCNQQKLAIVPQGGNTGLVGGS